MNLKRQYEQTDDGPRLVGVTVLRAGRRQRFSQRLVDRALAEGWLAMGQGQLMLDTTPPLVYRILRTPGRYCCHCGIRLPDDASGEGARAHVASEHPRHVSPDPQNPSGYVLLTAYDCERVDGEHAPSWRDKLFGRFRRG